MDENAAERKAQVIYLQMKPQDRVDAIIKSKARAPLKMLLVVIASHYGTNGCSWAGPKRMAAEAGLSLTYVRALLKTAEEAGVLSMKWEKGRSTRTIRICWWRLERYDPKPSKGGGEQGV